MFLIRKRKFKVPTHVALIAALLLTASEVMARSGIIHGGNGVIFFN